ncbi:MAG: hypothetical protein AAGB11_04090 [Pseudomonadota bacterium]
MRDRFKHDTYFIEFQRSSDRDTDTTAREAPDHGSLAALAYRFMEIEDALFKFDELGGFTSGAQGVLLEEQDAIINMAAAIPTRSLLDVAFKLLIWRTDAADLEATAVSRADRLLLSLCQELVGPVPSPGSGATCGDASAGDLSTEGTSEPGGRGRIITPRSYH